MEALDERGVTVLGKAEFKYPRLERLWTGRAMPPNRVMFRIVPAHVRCWGVE